MTWAHLLKAGVDTPARASRNGLVRGLDLEDARASRGLIFVAFAGASIGLLSSLVHLSTGDTARAAFTAAVALPILSTLLVLRWTRRVDLSVHMLCAIFTLGLVASPFFSSHAPPIFIGMIVVPIAAASLGGVRAGLIWSLVSVVPLLASAVALADDARYATIAWNAAIVAGVCAVAALQMEHSRDEAMRELKLARDRAAQGAQIRAQAESALKDSQALFATAFHRTPAILVVTRFDTGEILDVNESFSRISGWRADEVLGRSLADLEVWTDRDVLAGLCKALRRDGSIQNVELGLRTKAGVPVSHLVSAEVIEFGGRACLLAQGIDITDRKRGEDALARSRAELELRVAERGEQLRASLVRLDEQQRLVAVGTLAAGIAHQINNPIGGIAAAAEFALLAREDATGTTIRDQALETVLAEARRCGRIVKSVLQFARDEPTRKWVEDLNPVVIRASEQVREYVEGRGGRLNITLTSDRLPVRMSPIDVEQAVVNLIRNGAESRKQGANVEVETRRVGDEALIRVSDDGHGIDEKLRARILEPFFTTRLGEGGSGLGLSVVHGVVSDHAGRLETETTTGLGTRFGIWLPLEWREHDRDAE